MGFSEVVRVTAVVENGEVYSCRRKLKFYLLFTISTILVLMFCKHFMCK